MKVLWLCNIMLPVIAKSLGQKVVVKEGWLSGLADKLIANREENGCELAVCFPIQDEILSIPEKKEYFAKGSLPGIEYYAFHEDTSHPECYDDDIEVALKAILDAFKPDVVHCFGTEYPHTLAMVKAFANPDRLLIGIQGLCYVYADYYMANLPYKVQHKKTIRDIIRKDSIREQQQKFVLRGEYEKEAICGTRHITGRTDWDRKCTQELNPTAKYHFMNETLRLQFYLEQWNIDYCERYSIFVSQGNYPIKGLHYALQALPAIKEFYPEVKLYVAGDKITSYSTIKDKIKISSYGKYIRELIHQNDLEKNVIFLGSLDADKMCARFLQSHVFLLPSAIENSPNSLGEAMLMGVPVVSADVGGVHNLCVHKKEGFLYQPERLTDMANYIMEIFEDDKLAMSLSTAAREHAQKTHDPNVNYNRLLEIYHEINHSI